MARPLSAPRLVALEDRNAPAVLTVGNTIDGPVTQTGALPGSLRQAVFDANLNPGADTITFSSFFATPHTITLTAGELSINGAVAVAGSGSSMLTISGNRASRIFNTTA